MIELVWGLYTGRKVDMVAILFEDIISYLSVSQKAPIKIHSARFWAMCIAQLYRTYGVAIPEAADDIPLAMSPFKGYSPKYDLIFGAIRRLSDAFLIFSDQESNFVKQHLAIIENVDPYLPKTLRKDPPAKKGKNKAESSPPSDQGPRNKKPRNFGPKPEADAVNTKLDSLLSFVIEIKASQSNEAIIKEITELRKKVEVLEKKKLSLDSSVKKAVF
ncbi:hypothetical protein L2E82_30842 [Cichorium intybus]|uniref:Uncharacterized protein n=1 Tax=Cichorium intybus TaxID=13427 RepID=A0ACB9D1T1_CICIN|nr:hypothetical protein L2E82_30842 [Cichorium intybus]